MRNTKAKGTPDEEAQAVVASLKRLGTKRTREGMARYAIPSDKAFGVPMATMQAMAKRLGRNHELAAALWETGCTRPAPLLHMSTSRPA